MSMLERNWESIRRLRSLDPDYRFAYDCWAAILLSALRLHYSSAIPFSAYILSLSDT